MRKLVPTLTLALALAACSTADNAADQLGNTAEATGDVLVNAGEDMASITGNAAADIGNAVSDATTGHDAWVGRWTGVEGTYLNITKAALPDHYKLEMQYTLDSKGTYDGTGTKEGITFTRPDGKQLLAASDGDATGLKWLAGKKDCLKVKDGEGYCRD
ncbi:MAG: hypothetical protein EOP62_11230 [Sphingomonadales bacterium]|nr:MAG: hypothetical protein EOP62_11230 [Sphingomonadales bacterium]